jgi:hypothetical protein
MCVEAVVWMLVSVILALVVTVLGTRVKRLARLDAVLEQHCTEAPLRHAPGPGCPACGWYARIFKIIEQYQ